MNQKNFLRFGAAAGLGLSEAAPQPQPLLSLPSDNASRIELSIPQLQALMSSGTLTTLDSIGENILRYTAIGGTLTKAKDNGRKPVLREIPYPDAGQICIISTGWNSLIYE